MRVIYTPLSERDWLEYYKGVQHGGRIVGFTGERYQRGAGLGSMLKGLFRLVLPLAKSAGKAIGMQALETGKEFADDILGGENLSTSLKKRSNEAVGKLIKKGAHRIVTKLQTGKGLGMRRKKTIKAVGYRRKAVKKRRDALGEL